MRQEDSGVRDRPGSQAPVAVLAVVMLAMVMIYSTVMVRSGAGWQVAVAVPVSLTASVVVLVRLAFATHRPGVWFLARRVLQAIAVDDMPGRTHRDERLR